jgi:hypothetical protein
MEPGMLTCLLHQPIRLRYFSFLEIGTGNAYHDLPKYQSDALFWRIQLPIRLGELAHEFADWFNKGQVQLAISGFTMDWLAEWSPTALAWLQEWRMAHQIPFLQMPYIPSCAAWMPGSPFEKAITQPASQLVDQPRKMPQQVHYMLNVFHGEFAPASLPIRQLSDRLLGLGWKEVHPAMQSWPTIGQAKPMWLSNQLQQSAFEAWYALKPMIEQADDRQLHDQWRSLQAMELFFDMRTEVGATSNAAAFERYISYMNILGDLKQRLG